MASLNFVNVHGHSVSIERLAAQAKPKASVKATRPENFSKGIFVRGVEPGRFEAAAGARDKEIQAALKNNADGGKKHLPVPVVLTLSDFLLTAKRKKLGKRFEIRSSAEQMKEMLEKAGWLAVEVFDDTGGKK